MKALKLEQLRVLFLDQQASSLLDERIHVGTATSVEVKFRHIVGHALLVHSPVIVIAHNHPSGDPTPSKQDIDYTQRLFGICKALDIRLHDHVIVSGNGSFSFREAGYM